jgi:transcriptional regulator with XRE-family HTH domain
MINTHALFTTLKKLLKSGGYTYAHIAEYLCLSEASIKRMFAEERLTLQRLEQICQMINIDFIDLAQQIEHDSRRIKELSPLQEQQLVDNPARLLVGVSVLYRLTLNDMINSMTLSKEEILEHLHHLSGIGLISMMPDNRIRLLIARDFSWLPNGPIERYFRQKVHEEYFDYDFCENIDKLRVLNASLSPNSINVLHTHMERLVTLLLDLEQHDSDALPARSRQQMTMLLAIRPWNISAFDPYRRDAS